MSSHLRGGEPV